jgi:hypothetical protein
MLLLFVLVLCTGALGFTPGEPPKTYLVPCNAVCTFVGSLTDGPSDSVLCVHFPCITQPLLQVRAVVVLQLFLYFLHFMTKVLW